MNLSNLQIGQEVKNYKEMCKLLGKNICAGTSKIYQLKNWERYFRWHKEGNKFIIDEIYDLPKEKIDKRGKSENSHATLYGKYIETLVLDLLAQNMKHNITTVNFSKSSLLEALAMVNADYKIGLQNKQILSKSLNIDKEYITQFYNNSYSNLQKTLESALKRLSNKSLITWREAITLANSKGSTTVASDVMEKIFTKVEVETMKELGCKSRREVVWQDKWIIFVDEVCDKLKNYDIDCNYYYRSYRINFNEYIIEELEELTKYLLENDERLNTQLELNNKIVNNYKENNQKRYEKYLNQFSVAFGECLLTPYDEIKISENYVPYGDKLVDELISINHTK